MLYRLEPIKKRSFHVNERTNSNNGKHWKTVFQFILLSERYSNILQAPYTACRVFMTNTKEHISGNELGKQGRLVRKPVSLIYLGLFTHFINLSATFILDDLVSTILAKKNKTGLCPPMLIAHICHNRHNRRWCTFLSWCTFSIENAKFWPFLAYFDYFYTLLYFYRLFCREFTHFLVYFVQA